MKIHLFTKLLIIFLCTFTFVGCNDDDSNKWYDSMPDGGPFHTGNSLRFFYVDEEGNDLINLEDYSTLPVSSLEQLNAQPVIESLYNNSQYNNNNNTVVYDEQRGLYEFFTYAFGDSRQSYYTFYVYHNGIADKMEVTFKYQNQKLDSGYASSIQTWKVNGVEVYNINEPSMRKYVYLVKKQDGTTSVVLEDDI